jgi:hypothetical protein
MATTRGLRPLVASPDGQPLWFTQEPSILTPDYAGAVTLSNFVVSGDVPTLRFQSVAPLNEGDIETWTRAETQLIGGRLVSVFNPVWGGDALARVLTAVPFGWDKHRIEWGEVLSGATLPGAGLSVALRISPRNLQTSTVVPLSGDVQYSSNSARQYGCPGLSFLAFSFPRVWSETGAAIAAPVMSIRSRRPRSSCRGLRSSGADHPQSAA